MPEADLVVVDQECTSTDFDDLVRSATPTEEESAMTSVIFAAEIFPEGNVYVGLCRELGVSSFGDSPDQAGASLKEAVGTFLEGCRILGTLTDVLEESGFEMTDGTWRLREPVKMHEIATVP